jgi:hypothetical protein
MMAARVKAIPLTKPGPKRVYDIGAPKVHGTIISDHGIDCETAQVEWDSPEPWGKRGLHIKRFLRKVGEDAITENEKQVFRNASKFVVMDISHQICVCKTFAHAKAVALEEKKRKFSIHAVTKAENSIIVLRSLWNLYDKL